MEPSADEIAAVPEIYPSDYLVLTSRGELYRVGQELVAYDFSEALTILGQDLWKMLQEEGPVASSVLNKTTIGPRDIVVLEYTKEGHTRRNWFIRVQFSGPTSAPMHYVGERFLWPLSHQAAMRMVVALKDHRRQFHRSHPNIQLTLPAHIDPDVGYPTSDVFDPEDHVGTGYTANIPITTSWKNQLSLLCWGRGPPPPPEPLEERARAMAARWAAPRNKKPPPQKTRAVAPRPPSPSWARPANLRAKRTKMWHWLPDDVVCMILDQVAQTLIHSPAQRDLKTLVKLRRVNKRFKATLEREAVAWTQGTLTTLDAALQSGRVHALQALGRSLIQRGVNPCLPYASWTGQQWGREDAHASVLGPGAVPFVPRPVTLSTFLEWKRGRRERARDQATSAAWRMPYNG